jgi:hypothetical protein
VATNKSGKKRLILDPSVLNKFANKRNDTTVSKGVQNKIASPDIH